MTIPTESDDHAPDEMATAGDPQRRLAATALVAAVVVAVDQATKQWAVGRLSAGPCTPETCIDVVGSLRFHLHFNTGASFSTGEGLGRWFGVVAIIMSGFLLRLAYRSSFRWSTVLVGLVLGGAVGNLIDRVVRAEDGLLTGAVIDFIDVQWWPIFNVADAAIVCGVVCILAVHLLWGDETSEADE